MAKKIVNQNVWLGLFFVSLGGLLLAVGIPLFVEEDRDLRLPVSLVPNIVSVLLVLTGLLLVFDNSDPVPGKPEQNNGAVLASVAIIVLALLALSVFPFLVVAPVLLAALMVLYGGRNPIRIVLSSVGASLIIWVVVRYGFERLLP